MSGAGAPIVVLDTSVVIAFREPADAHHARAVAAFTRHQGEELVLPASAYAEALVGPSRRGPAAIASFDRFISDLAARIEPLTREIARQAARLRSRHVSLRPPDALILATGDVLDADLVLTADAAWPKAAGESASSERACSTTRKAGLAHAARPTRAPRRRTRSLPAMARGRQTRASCLSASQTQP